MCISHKLGIKNNKATSIDTNVQHNLLNSENFNLRKALHPASKHK